MADRIKLLPEVVANQIAAGEVVNRPSSVVKEMMENAIDAGARSVTVNVRDGGRELIQIVDDGCGMSPIDARLAFDRHATSKIASLDDIYALRTFGFRGEALASIAAVSQVELRTRQAADEVGTLTTINGGEFFSQEPVACPAGAQFCVRNLFYNVPARRKFLEKSATSSSQIKAEFQRVALCNPGVAFELRLNDQPVYRLAAAATLAVRIVDVVGRHVKQNLLEVEADTSIVRIAGYVGRPSAAKKSGAEQYLFVNGRYFRSGYFGKAVLKAYEKLIPENCAPAYFLYLTIDPSRIDVNVHPQKTEVKFADEEAVWQIINAAVRETLAKTGAVPQLDFDETERVEIPVAVKGAVYREPRAMSNEAYNPFQDPYSGELAGRMPDVTFADFDSAFDGFSSGGGFGEGLDGGFGAAEEIVSERFSSGGSELEFIPSGGDGVQQRLVEEPEARFSEVVSLGNGYASALYGGRWVAVDLRRARERVLFDNYRLLLVNGSSVGQQLLFPQRLELSPGEYALLEEHEVEFAALGFDLELCGGGAVELRGIPADIAPDAVEESLYELLQTFRTPVSAQELRRDKIAGAMARSGARAMPRTIPSAEAAMLLEQLREGGNVSFTPSGKAILAEITTEEIRAKLG